jgi:putative hydrolase of the HAD superfamily
MIEAVLWDFGGVISTSPFEAFNRYESDRGLPRGFIRTLNATNPDHNAWAHLERGDVSFDEFCALYEAEALAAGARIDAREVMALLGGDIRPAMVTAIRRCREHLKTGLLTNNFVRTPGSRGEGGGVLDLFDAIVESSRTGVRKPDPRFYQMACELLEISPPEAVFLDDLGINLKPARALGMTTIKVVDADEALDELERVVGFSVR